VTVLAFLSGLALTSTLLKTILTRYGLNSTMLSTSSSFTQP
jgi:hypothetical protein